MNVKPIRNESDYRAHLARIDTLIEASPGTQEADELEVLATLVDLYESEAFPIELPSPVQAIRFRMEQQNLGPRDLEPFLGSRSRVSEVLNGSRSLSIDMIRALNQHLGIPAEVLIREEPLGDAKSTPLPKLVQKQLSAWGILRGQESLESLLSRAFGSQPATAMLRKTRTARTNAKTDGSALQAWCAAALLRSNGVTVRGRFDRGHLDLNTVRQLAQLSVFEDGPVRVREALSDLGIALVILPHLPGTHLDGAAMCRSDGVPVIALTLRRDRVDNFWFTLLHELAHVARHLNEEQFLILDDLEIQSSEQIEQEADGLAEIALIPQEIWALMRHGRYASQADIEQVARLAGVSPAIVAGRWQLHNRDFRKFSKLLGHGTVRSQFPEFAS